MKTFTRFLILVALITVVATTFDEFRDRRAYSETQRTIARFNGTFTSLPLWPFGAEYFVTIRDRELTDDELSQLSDIDALGKRGIYRRNLVGVRFFGTNLRDVDLARVRAMFPHCAVFITAKED